MHRKPIETLINPGTAVSVGWSLLAIAMLALTLVLPTRSAAAQPTIVDGAEVSDRRILVRFEPGTDPGERSASLDGVDGTAIRSYSLVPRLELVRIPAGTDVERAVADLEAMPGVAYAEFDPIRRTEASTPNDPFYSSGYLWGQNNVGQTFTVSSTSYTGTPDADVDAPEAWDLTRGSSQVTVAVIDSGMQLSHPDLAANLWTNPDEVAGNGIDDDSNGRVDDVNGWDFINGDNNPSDDYGHGSHVAGTIGARGNNSTGVTGLAWTVRMAALKACNSTGSCPLSATLAALDYAVDEGIMISNNSYGGLDTSEYLPERQAIQAARDAGHLFIAAAGNDSANTEAPSPRNFPSGYDLDNIIAVAATTLNDGLAGYSNYGVTTVDVGAPGSQVLSTVPTDGYSWANGTSMATPQVAGLAALIKSRKPNWTYTQIRDRILGNTRPIAALAGKTVTGGVINAFDALDFAPDPPAVSSGPSGPTGSTSATLAFTGETVGAGVSFECRIDAGSWGACSSPRAYASLSQGSHTFEVKQTDLAANTSDPAARTWTVDTVAPPAPSITSGPSGTVASTSASIAFTGEASATFECRIDAGSWGACSSPKAYASLSQGSHTFDVRQSDQAGNLSTEASRTWTVDTVPPAAPTVTGAPTGFVASTSASISISGEASATFECQLNFGSWAGCSSPVSLSGLGQGLQTFGVRQRDTAGNVSVEALRQWTVDTVTPSPPSITSGPSGTVTSDTATFEFTGETSATFGCRIDSGAWEACTSPKTYPALSPVAHTFEVRQADRAGNTSDPTARTWTIEVPPPGPPSIDSAPSGFSQSTTGTVAFSGVATATFECLIDGGIWSACTSPLTLSGLGEGPHQVQVRQTISPGGTSEPATVSWTVDTVAPTAPAITSAPPDPSGSAEATFSFTGDASATFECRLDSGTWSACASPETLSSLSEGFHLFEVRQSDQAGNASDPDSHSWEVRLTVPQPEITGGPDGQVNSDSATISFTGEPGATFRCRLDDGPLVSCSSPWSIDHLDAGSHTFGVEQEDLLGNVSQEATVAWEVLEVATVTPTIGSMNPDGTIAISGATGTLTYLCGIDGSPLEPCGAPIVPEGLTDGPHTVALVITDGEGNLSDSSEAEVVISGAPAPPVGPVGISVAGGSTYARSTGVEVGLVWPAGARKVVLSTDGDFTGPTATLSPVTSATLPGAVGERTVAARFLGPGDTVLATVTDSVFLDTRLPRLRSARVKDRIRRNWLVAVWASDSGSGLGRVQISTQRTRPGPVDPSPLIVLPLRRSRDVVVRSVPRPRWARVLDRAGNPSPWKSIR